MRIVEERSVTWAAGFRSWATASSMSDWPAATAAIVARQLRREMVMAGSLPRQAVGRWE